MLRFNNRVLVFVLVSFGLLTACGNNNTAMNSAGVRNNTANTTGNAAVATTSPASASPTADTGTHTLTDAMGHQVEVPSQPQRIIAPFLEDPLSSLGIKPVAQWGASGEPQAYLQDKLKDVPVLSMDQGLKPEETLSYSPDLIIILAPAYLGNSTYEQFAAIAPTYVLTSDGGDWRETMEKLGDLLGQRELADQKLKEFDEKLAAAKATINSTVGEKTAVLLQPNDDKSFKLFGPGFYGGAMLYEGLGFKQPGLLKGSYELYSMETLAQLKDGDYIFVLTGKGRSKIPADNSLWNGLPAVKEGHVFDADSGHWFNANPIANGLIVDDVLSAIQK